MKKIYQIMLEERSEELARVDQTKECSVSFYWFVVFQKFNELSRFSRTGKQTDKKPGFVGFRLFFPSSFSFPTLFSPF